MGRRSGTIGAAGAAFVAGSDITGTPIERYARWQEAVATLGQIALASATLHDLMEQSVRRLAETLQIEYVAILELNPQGDRLTLRAGRGWRKGLLGTARVDASAQTQVGFTLLANEPVVLPDMRSDTRFVQLPLLNKLGVLSAMTVTIGGRPRPYGVLGVYSKHRREFPADEIRFLRTAANILAAAVRGFEADQAQRDGAARVRAIVTTLVDGIITIDERGTIESINAAAERIFGYTASEVVGLNVNVLMPEPYHREHDRYDQNYLTTGRQRIIGIGREVSGQRKDGSTFPMDLAVSEMQVSGKRMFTGVVRDITERRRMEREILEAGADEQRRIGQDLHDGLCQHLAGISFATEVLRQKLAARSAPEAVSISKVVKMIDEAITQARGLARGLQPVMLDANGLVTALKELVEKVEEMFHVDCLFVCDAPCPVYDNNIATHLFRIAQEAISNAVKHGKARTVVVDLTFAGDQVCMTIKDDGIGLKRDPGDVQGMGLRTMDYRARVIGGTLSVESGKLGGTTIVCRVRNQSTNLGRRRRGPAESETSAVELERLEHGEKEGRSREAKGKDSRRRRSSHRPRTPG